MISRAMVLHSRKNVIAFCFAAFVLVYVLINKQHADICELNRSPEPSKTLFLNEHSTNPIENYYRYPCLKELAVDTTTPCVRTVCRGPPCQHLVQCTALPLKIIENTAICTYNTTEDYIARSISGGGGWEDGLVLNMIEIFKANPDMMLVDIGCNIGVFTLAAAWMSRRVICVDANYENIHMVHTSLSLGHLTENVTLIWNGVSYQRGFSSLEIFKENVGESRMGDLHLAGQFKVSKKILLQTILLDELLPLVRGKTVFMKMDVEGYELNALKGATQFLKEVDVRYIQMELNTPAIRLDIMKILNAHGFLMHKDHGGRQRIGISDIPELGNADVYFIKAKELFKD